MARSYNRESYARTRATKLQHEHEQKLKFMELMKEDTELKYYLIFLASIGSIELINYISSLQTNAEIKKALAAFEKKIPDQDTSLPPPGWKDIKVPAPPPKFTQTIKWEDLTEAGRQQAWRLYNIKHERDLKDTNYQFWDEILGGAFGTAAGFSAGILVLKAMYRNGPPAGVGSVATSLGLIGATTALGTGWGTVRG